MPREIDPRRSAWVASPTAAGHRAGAAGRESRVEGRSGAERRQRDVKSVILFTRWELLATKPNRDYTKSVSFILSSDQRLPYTFCRRSPLGAVPQLSLLPTAWPWHHDHGYLVA